MSPVYFRAYAVYLSSGLRKKTNSGKGNGTIGKVKRAGIPSRNSGQLKD